MSYTFLKDIRTNDKLRTSFNDLTRRTFDFDFENWYRLGHWGEMYIPYVLLDGDKVISNVSVNIMQFDVKGQQKTYIQLGTVMTDEAYRGQGLNRKIMELVLEEYQDKVDGIYLFGNDDVVEYYPKFGFIPAKEYEYYLPCEKFSSREVLGAVNINSSDETGNINLVQVDMSDEIQVKKFYDFIRRYPESASEENQNTSFYMSHNLGLYQFWLPPGKGKKVFYLPETDNYVVAKISGEVLHIQQIFGRKKVDLLRLAKGFRDNVFDKDIKEIVLGFTPCDTKNLLVREHKEEDCTLFIIGTDLERVEQDKLMFPVLSHA